MGNGLGPNGNGSYRAIVWAYTGSRGYPLPDLVRAHVQQRPDGTLVHVGDARDVDTWVRTAAEMRDPPLPVIVFKPDYRTYPTFVAPLMRNGDIVKADHVTAFWDLSAGGTNGTGDALMKAIAYGAEIEIFDHTGALVPDPVRAVVAWRAGYESKRQARTSFALRKHKPPTQDQKGMDY